MGRSFRTPCALAFTALALTGCGLFSAWREDPLESVAKDWMRVIRASQVIPIYPLTEDIQPGDVFLVQTPVEEQAKAWKKSEGYLPLDYHIARLDPRGYASFYDHSFLAEGDGHRLPFDWRRVKEADSSEHGRGGEEEEELDEALAVVAGDDPDRDEKEDKEEGEDEAEDEAEDEDVFEEEAPALSWVDAPGAAFPTYSFSVDRSSGLNLAVPVSSVPVGLSLLGGEAVDGSLSLGRARTLGVDIASIYTELQVWGDQNRALLSIFGGRGNYLRVVTRIYLVGKVDVSMRTTRAGSAGVDAGRPRPVELVLPETGDDVDVSSAEAYRESLNALNGMVESQELGTQLPGQELVPGGSVRITAASARSISMSEDFDPPLVVGFLGFDVPILEGGELGPPIPTRALLEDKAEPMMKAPILGEPISVVHADAALGSAYELLRQRVDDPRALAHVAALDRLEERIPESSVLFNAGRNGWAEANKTKTAFAGDSGFKRFKGYFGDLTKSRNGLRRVLAGKVKDPQGNVVRFEEGETERLTATLAEQERIYEEHAAALKTAGRGAVAYLSSLID